MPDILYEQYEAAVAAAMECLKDVRNWEPDPSSPGLRRFIGQGGYGQLTGESEKLRKQWMKSPAGREATRETLARWNNKPRVQNG
jgi:hypothetical protein